MIDKKEFAKKWKKEYKEQMLKPRYTLDYYKCKIKRDFELNVIMHLVYNDIRGLPLNRGMENATFRLKDVLRVYLNVYSLQCRVTPFIMEMLGDSYNEYAQDFNLKVRELMNNIK